MINALNLDPLLRLSKSKSKTKTIPDVRQLLDEGLLGDSELVEIWKAVPKANEGVDRVDFDGFAQAFARVDALFEEEEEEKRGVVHAGGDGDDLGVGSIGGGVRAPSQADADATRSFIELAGSSGGLLDLAGLLRCQENPGGGGEVIHNIHTYLMMQ